MDGDGGGMDGGEMGSVSGVGTRGTDGRVDVESADDDSATSTLQSMGYMDEGTTMDGTGGESTGSWTSILQTAVIIAVVAFFAIATGYFLLSGILGIVGVQL